MKTRGNVGHQTRVVIAALANFLLRFGVGQAMTSKVLDRRLAIGPSGARAVYGRPGPKTRRHVIGGGHPQRRIPALAQPVGQRSEEHTSELQSLMRTSYAVFCLKKKKKTNLTP